MKRINVVGTSGSGKSTFSRRLAEALDIPHLEMDRIYWRENWGEPDNETLLKDVGDSLGSAAWVLDGNYSRTNKIKWAKCDTVIWLDYSFLRTLLQVVGRTITRVLTQKELWPGTGNRESFRRSFLSKDSIIIWMTSNFYSNRIKYKAILQSNDFPHITYIHVRSPKEADKLIRSVKTA